MNYFFQLLKNQWIFDLFQIIPIFLDIDVLEDFKIFSNFVEVADKPY